MANIFIICEGEMVTPSVDAPYVILGQLATLECAAITHVYSHPPFENYSDVMIIREPGTQPQYITLNVSYTAWSALSIISGRWVLPFPSLCMKPY